MVIEQWLFLLTRFIQFTECTLPIWTICIRGGTFSTIFIWARHHFHFSACPQHSQYCIYEFTSFPHDWQIPTSLYHPDERTPTVYSGTCFCNAPTIVSIYGAISLVSSIPLVRASRASSYSLTYCFTQTHSPHHSFSQSSQPHLQLAIAGCSALPDLAKYNIFCIHHIYT